MYDSYFGLRTIGSKQWLDRSEKETRFLLGLLTFLKAQAG
jgi:hypothetical protein